MSLFGPKKLPEIENNLHVRIGVLIFATDIPWIEHRFEIFIPSTEFLDWISESSECVSTMSLDLQPNASHNFLAIILVFEDGLHLKYSAMNITSGFV